LSRCDKTIHGGLTGSEQQIATAAKAFHVSYRRAPAGNGTVSIDHSSETILIDPSGRFVAHFPLDTSVEAMTAKLKAAVS
jgi:protein SCO1